MTPHSTDKKENVISRLAAAKKTQEPPLFRVVLHNDDFTPRQFVVRVLQKHFFKSDVQATFIMLTAHREGRSLVGVYPFAVAELKTHKACTEANQNSYPLTLTLEPEN